MFVWTLEDHPDPGASTQVWAYKFKVGAAVRTLRVVDRRAGPAGKWETRIDQHVLAEIPQAAAGTSIRRRRFALDVLLRYADQWKDTAARIERSR